MGQTNLYTGEILEYQPIWGSGAAVVSLTPSLKAARDLEFDENDPDRYLGERNVLGPNEADPFADFNVGEEEDAYGRPL